jgi:hypothetical protein
MTWTAFPYHDEAYVYDAERLKQTWARLHAGDVEPFPKKPARALELNPASPIAYIEYANALVTLDGKKKMDEAVGLYRQAAALEPQDAKERLEVELAREQLEEQ